MASGDLKDVDKSTVITVTAGASAIAIGDVVHFKQSDGLWYTVTTGDLGKFGVALDATAGSGTIRVCIWGEVEVKATAAAIAKGAYVIPGTTGFVVDAGTLDATSILGKLVGTAMTAFTSGGQGILWVGLVG